MSKVIGEVNLNPSRIEGTPDVEELKDEWIKS